MKTWDKIKLICSILYSIFVIVFMPAVFMLLYYSNWSTRALVYWLGLMIINYACYKGIFEQ